jgi:hypothetical protein
VQTTSPKIRLRRQVGGLVALFCVYFAIVLLRSWQGLNRIPTDPNYDYFLSEKQFFDFLFRTSPYLHFDNPLVSSAAGIFPIHLHALAANLISHVILALCAVGIFLALKRLGIQEWVGILGGLVLVLSPWAAQSTLGNYGNNRWPIISTSLIVIASEVARKQPSQWRIFIAAVLAAIANPIAIVITIPVAVSILIRRSLSGRIAGLVAAPPIAVLGFNLVLTNGSGHSARVGRLWDGAGLFWSTGLFLPTLIALLGIAILSLCRSESDDLNIFGLSVFCGSIAIALTSYRLGGIADRYFVAPAALAGIGMVVVLFEAKLRWILLRAAALGAVVLLVLIPSIKWFAIFPWLTSGPTWSQQVDDARRRCAAGDIAGIPLLTSDGITVTEPITCIKLK